MVGVFGARMVVQFNPKELGLSAEVSGTIFGQFGLWTVFGQFGAKLLCLFWAVSRQIVGLLISPCVLFLCYC